jgi:hypothetical protein
MDIYRSKLALMFAQNGRQDWAVTIGPVTFYSVPSDKVDGAWRAHEDCHKRQWRRYWYIGFAVLYLWESWRKGYQQNRFEVEARQAGQNS